MFLKLLQALQRDLDIKDIMPIVLEVKVSDRSLLNRAEDDALGHQLTAYILSEIAASKRTCRFLSFKNYI